MLLFCSPSCLVNASICQWSEEKKHFKVFKRDRVERQPVFLCSLTYRKVLVITKVTYAQRLAKTAINSPLCTFLLTQINSAVSSPQSVCRRWASKKSEVCPESCSDATSLSQDSRAWRALQHLSVWGSEQVRWRSEGVNVWQDCSPAPEQKAGKKRAV